MSLLQAPIICSFESRRAQEMCSLIERQGGIPLSAPSMREIPIEQNPVALEVVRSLIDRSCDAILLLTGVGTEALFDVAATAGLRDKLLAVLHEIPVIIRGPKPAAVLAKAGLRYTVKAAEPNTWREILTAIDHSRLALSGKRIVVQEYGLPNPRLYSELQARGMEVVPCPVYRWALPDDTAPLETAIRRIARGEVNVVLFTSANQVSSVLGVASALGLDTEFRRALHHGTRVCSIGPTCSEALLDNDIPVHGEASPPKMGQLVRVAMHPDGTGTETAESDTL